MARPPVLVGAVQLRLMVVSPSAVAVSAFGLAGALSEGRLTVTVLDGLPAPNELTACTRYLTRWSADSPVCVYVVDVPVVLIV